MKNKNIFKVNNFVYITNDEPLIEEDNNWIIDLYLLQKGSKEVIFKNKSFGRGTLNCCKKICLTNDTSLIEDGVQSVSSSFLSFFAENQPEYVEVVKMLQTKWGTEWHDLPNQESGREPEGIYRHIYTLNFGEKEDKTEEKLYTKEDLQIAHQMGAIFAYGRKSVRRSERLEHFEDWVNKYKTE